MGTLGYKFPVHSFERQAVTRLGLQLLAEAVAEGKVALPEKAVREMDAMREQLSKLIRRRKRDLTAEMQQLAALSEKAS